MHLFQSYLTFEVPIFTEKYATIREFGNNSKISIEVKQTKEDMKENNDGNTPLNELTDRYVNGSINYDEFEKEVKALYSCKKENMEEKKIQHYDCFFDRKPTLKEFDLEAAKAGKPVYIRDGRKARIICFDAKRKNGQNIIALVPSKDYPGFEDLIAYPNNGNYQGGHKNDGDLMILSEKKEGWVNLYTYKDYDEIETGIKVYNTEKEAKEGIKNNSESSLYLDTIKITWEG